MYYSFRLEISQSTTFLILVFVLILVLLDLVRLVIFLLALLFLAFVLLLVLILHLLLLTCKTFCIEYTYTTNLMVYDNTNNAASLALP